MKTTLFLLLSFFSIQVNSNPGWTLLNVPVTANMVAIKFYDPLHGYAAGIDGDNTVLVKTSDGGDSWTASSVTAFKVTAIHVTGPNSLFIAGHDLQCNCASVISSTNGGETWINTDSRLIEEAGIVYDIKSGDNIAVGGCDNGTTILSTNDFSTYSFSTDGTETHICQVEIINESLLALAGPAPGEMNRILLNPGNHWDEIKSFAGDTVVSKVACISENLIFASIKFGAFPHTFHSIIKTLNGGHTWETSFDLPDDMGSIMSVCFRNPDHGYAFTSTGKIISTFNGGASWNINEEAIETLSINDLFMVNANYGFTAGNSGEIFRLGNALSIKDIAERVEINTFPNPVDDNLRLRFSGEAAIREISIYDISGREMRRQNKSGAAGSEIQVEVSDLNPGNYLIRCTDQSGAVRSVKFIKS